MIERLGFRLLSALPGRLGRFFRRVFLERASKRRLRRDFELVEKWERRGVSGLHLDRTRIGPDTDEYERMVAAASIVSRRLETVAADKGVCWCYGDSKTWMLIVSTCTESELRAFVSRDGIDRFAQLAVEQIAGTFELREGFHLTVEVDSDERVKANEGWGFRVKGCSRPGLRFSWRLSDEGLVRVNGEASAV